MSITITLSQAASKIVQSRIASGAFDDANSVIEAALIGDAYPQNDVDTWINNRVLPTLELNRHDPSRSISSTDVYNYLKEHIDGQNKANAA